jgi:hypothetical protein
MGIIYNSIQLGKNVPLSLKSELRGAITKPSSLSASQAPHQLKELEDKI